MFQFFLSCSHERIMQMLNEIIKTQKNNLTNLNTFTKERRETNELWLCKKLKTKTKKIKKKKNK